MEEQHKIYLERCKNRWGDRFDYSETVFGKFKDKIKIICPEHGVFEKRLDSFLNSKTGCPICKYIDTEKTANFIKKSKEIHGDKFDYSLVEYINNRTKVKIICTEHGVFEQIPQSHLNGNGCEKCHIQNLAKVQTKNTDWFIKKAKEVHGDKFDYSLVDYKHTQLKVKIICPEHGVFEQKPNSHLQGKGCNKCRYDKYRKPKDKFVKEANSVHNHKYDYSVSEYISDKKKLDVMCLKHGVFKQSPNRHLTGSGCPKCKSSKGELRVEKYLKDNDMKYEFQKSFDDLKNKSYLIYDFYLPEQNIAIEYDGRQHFKIIEHFGGRSAFMKNKHRDKLKNKYCEENNITLIRIPYTDYDNIEDILNTKII